MHRPQRILACVLLAALSLPVANPSPSLAALLMGPAHITPSTTLPNSGQGFTINQIADGITADSPFNGFAAAYGLTGIIRLDLTSVQHLASFTLWNDINVFQEGVRDFRLDFYDASNNFLGSSPQYVGPIGSVPGVTYTFPSVVGNVKRVDFVVLTLNNSACCGTRLEVREVAFNSGSITPTNSSTWGRIKALYR